MTRTHYVVVLLVAFAVVGCGKRTRELDRDIVIVVHGGAGTILKEQMTPEREKAYRSALEQAMQAGFAILQNDGSSLDAVEAATRVLEDSPLFNAGKGAVFTSQGKNEMDASIMDGATLNAGAVASVTTIKNPVSAARAVMERSKHVMLVGRGAEIFAAECGLEIVPPEYFFTQERWDALLKAKESEKATAPTTGDEPEPAQEGDEDKHGSARVPRSGEEARGSADGQAADGHAVALAPEDHRYGTVAALALDRRGNLAAATSTGGLTNKMYGRVGDSPIIGAGTYANNATCAVSGTGQGEYYMRNLLAYRVSAFMEFAGVNVGDAVHQAIDGILTPQGGEGGLIALDKDGHVAMYFNTPGMYRGYMTSRETRTFLYKED